MNENDSPVGWNSRSLYGIADFANGAAYRDMDFSPDRAGLPVIKIVELKMGVTASTKFSTVDLGDRYKIESGDVLFSWSGNPDTSIDTFIWLGGQAWLNQHIFRVRENGTTPRAALYFQLKALKPVFAEIARDKQTTGLGHVTAADMRRLMVCNPPAPIAIAFDEIARPILQNMIASQLETRTLATTQELLLPRLMSGKIRLKDAEKVVETVL